MRNPLTDDHWVDPPENTCEDCWREAADDPDEEPPEDCRGLCRDHARQAKQDEQADNWRDE